MPTIAPPAPDAVVPVASGLPASAPALAEDDADQGSTQNAPPAEAEAAPDPDGIIVTARKEAPPGDPLVGVNEVSYDVVQGLDKALVAPVSMAYKSAVPQPVRAGLRNFLNNLQEPLVFLNYMLQLKPGKAAETVGRFAVNSTIGAAGLFDVARKKPFKLPRRNNGFGTTLGYYGVKPGPFLFLPIIGPTSARDIVGRWLDLLVLPAAIGKPFSEPTYAIATTAIRALDDRVEADKALREIRDGPRDPYSAMRDAYLQRRQAEIDVLKGKIPDPLKAN